MADDKFGDVIAAFEARGGWRRHAHLSFPKPVLRWTNYAKIPWPRVASLQIVNHLQHAVLFSQKDRLAALLYAYQARLEASGAGEAGVNAFYPRTFDLRRSDAWRELKKWAVYSEAVAVAKRFSRSQRLAECGGEQGNDALELSVVRCAVAFLQAALRDASFFRRPHDSGDGTSEVGGSPTGQASRETTPASVTLVDVDASEWRALSARWTTDGRSTTASRPSFSEATISREAVAELLRQLAQRDPQFGAVGDDDDGDGEKQGCVWICKPSNLSQGRGIALVHSLDDLVAIVNPSNDDAADVTDATNKSKTTQHWVVQKYVERPLLCQDGRKFDIRQWVLVTALPPAAQAYWYRDCYLRFCAQPFSLHTAASRQDRFAHLSNYSVQKDFVAAGDHQGEESNVPPPAFESMWSSEFFRDTLRYVKHRHAVWSGLDGELTLTVCVYLFAARGEHGSDVWEDMIVPRMQAVARHVMRAVLPELRMVGVRLVALVCPIDCS